jgi:hypothetical protein
MKNTKKLVATIILGNILFFTILFCLPPNLYDENSKTYTSMARMGTENMKLKWISPNLGGTFLYRVYASNENNIDSVEDMVVNGTLICDWTWNINEFNVTYKDGFYFNVMVKNVLGFTRSYKTFRIAGVFGDLSETLEWMNETLTDTEKLVTIDLEEDSEDLGLIGLAMMQTNETLSVEIINKLEADYIMVYFGHLLNGLYGNEGTWSYIMDACNENTLLYKSMGLEQDNW